MLEIDADGNDTLQALIDYANRSEELQQYWDCTNTMAVDRLGYNDHGEKHIEIVAGHALQLLRLLRDHRDPGIVTDYGMTQDDAEAVVFLAALLHDTGHIIHRYNHSEYSLITANQLIDRILADLDLYTDRERVIIKSETLHAIQSHHKKANPLTMEAGILRVADALDMEKGRATAARENGDRSIHAISALSVEDVSVVPGDDTPVRIEIQLSNSSGVFQLDELAKNKIQGSGIEDLLALRAETADDEKNILDEYEL